MESGEYEIVVPPELVGGVYANFLGVWHTAHEFTLDFATLIPDERLALGVSRVRVAPTIVFDVSRRISDALARYEQAHGHRASTHRRRRMSETPFPKVSPPLGTGRREDFEVKLPKGLRLRHILPPGSRSYRIAANTSPRRKPGQKFGVI